MRSSRRSSSTSNPLSVGTAGLEATTSRSRARSSIVVPGEASATSDRSPAVLVGRRTTSESVSSSTSRCSSSDIGSNDIGSSRSLLGRDWRQTGLVVQAQSRSVAKSAWLARRSVVRNELGVRVRLLSHRDRVAVVAVALGGVDNARSRAARCGPARPAPSLLTEPSASPSTRHRRKRPTLTSPRSWKTYGRR